MDLEEIREAMENVAVIRECQMQIGARRAANDRDIAVTRRAFIRFLELLEGDVTVSDIRDALELSNVR